VNGRRALAGLLLAAAALGAGCGGSAAGTSAGSAGSVARTINPKFDTGQTVLITRNTVRPLWLVSLVGKPIIFRNLSGGPVRVVFDNVPGRSGPIAPGDVFRYMPTGTINISYHVGSRAGQVQVSPMLGGGSTS
jgi:hypothetical protein